MDKARRRHVPAFGEWNYYYSSSSSASLDDPAPPHSGAVAAEPEQPWCWYAPEEAEACSDAWFRYSPPPRRRRPPPAPKKARRPEIAVAVAAEHKTVATERSRATAAAARTPGKGAGRRVVVRPVDEDLYRVPPPDDHTPTVSRPVPRRQTKRAARRSLWMGCLGLNCVA